VVREALHTYVAGSDDPVVTAQAFFEDMNDGDDSNEYSVLSVRSLEHYDIGHIPGAVSVPWKESGDATKLSVLPGDQPIVVYCYTGHTSAVATMALRMLGYEAYNMKFGIMAWTKDQGVRVNNAFNEDTDANEFPTESSGGFRQSSDGGALGPIAS